MRLVKKCLRRFVNRLLKNSPIIQSSDSIFNKISQNLVKISRGGEMVDTKDLKSFFGNKVWVRIPPAAPNTNTKNNSKSKTNLKLEKNCQN